MKPHVLFVSGPPGLGGSNISLATVLEHLAGRVHRIVATPAHGRFHEIVIDRGLADDRFRVDPRRRRGRGVTSLRLAWFVWRKRKSLTAIHANALTGLYLSAIAAILSGVPVVVWVHDPVTTRFGTTVGPWLRRMLRNVRWAAVSEVAAQVAIDSGLCNRSEITIVPNPIAPEEVVAPQRSTADVVRIGYLGSASERKGFDILVDVAKKLPRDGVSWRLFTADRRDDARAAWWNELDGLPSAYLTVPGVDADVRRVYAQCDIVFNPSREESFCRVGAEAMANGIPVVAGDIPPLRDMLGDDVAGLLYPVEDVDAAVAALEKVVADPELRSVMGRAGRKRAKRFAPGPVVAALSRLYGLSTED